MFAVANDAVVLNGAAVQFSYSPMKGTYQAWVRFRTILSPDQLHQPVVSAPGRHALKEPPRSEPTKIQTIIRPIFATKRRGSQLLIFFLLAFHLPNGC